ncbi:MAG: hypothetical protein LBP76_10230 [Treponema sp.]|jgi:hypothetical protein|nr:hypothetical protein [Treponema sp.]
MTGTGAREAARAELEDRKVFRRAFGTGDGKNALTWILNECGYFSQDPKNVDQLLIAFCNRLLCKIGINQPGNLFEDVAARVDGANDRDLEEIISNGGDDEPVG